MAKPADVDAGPTDRLPAAELTFLLGGRPFMALQADGLLRVGEHTMGRLSRDGTFFFEEGEGRVTARLTDDGRVVVQAAQGINPARIAGPLGAALRRHGENKIESAYTIHDDGTASAPRVQPLSFDPDGRLSERGIVVHGLTMANRRTALFVYLLVATIS